MEVDMVKEDDCHQHKCWDWRWGEDATEELEVDYVGETCNRCGGMGHYVRECPTPKGKGKGGKGEGKAGKGNYKGGYKGNYDYFKGGYKGYKGDGKGKGKGFAGACWKCGEVGHRALNCTKSAGAGHGGAGGAGSNMEIGAVTEGDVAASVGGVWAIAAVQAVEWKEVKKGAGIKENSFKDKVEEVQCTNRFELLEVSGDYGEVQCGCGDLRCDANFEKAEKRTNHNLENTKNHTVKKVKFMNVDSEKASEKNGVQDKDFASICAVPFAGCCPPGLGSKKWRGFSIAEITVDSAAEESVCPRDWCTEFGTSAPAKWLEFLNPSGGQMGHYGERTANFRVVGKEAGIMSLKFQVSHVQKPLVAVRRIAEKGNVVQFGPKEEDNYIQNKVTGTKIAMIKKGGSYVIPAEMLVEDFTRQAQ
jgi:hypothetical protein